MSFSSAPASTLPSPLPSSSPLRVVRVRHELVRREVRVARTEFLNPSLVAITLTDPSLRGFTSLSFDDHVKFMFNDAAGELQRRDYTPRRIDLEAGELVIEFALHEHGPASDWARSARAGDSAIVAGPKGSMIIPLGYDWHLLVGDATAFPAIARRLEELPAGARATVVAAAPSEAERPTWASAVQLEVHWVNHADELAAAVARLAKPEGSGFAWGAGESSAMRALRETLLQQGYAKDQMRISAYWKRGAEGFHENLDQ
jgi:NADPH-dependent ferric siderophore reductase